jgi:hypothetical protein
MNPSRYLVAMLLAIAACGSSNDDSTEVDRDAAASADVGPDSGRDGGGQEPFAEVCTEFAEKLCERLNTCAPFIFRFVFGDRATCVGRQRLSCVAEVAAPGTGATAANMAACGNSLAAGSCGDLSNLRNLPACDIHGSRPAGGPCGSNAQCQSGACRREPNTLCGVCGTPVDEGDACVDDSACAAGLSCHTKCLKPQPLGMPCDASRPCQSGAYCKEAVCTAQGAAGAACIGEGSCDPGAGLFCNPAAGVCQAVAYASAGDSCGLVSGGVTICTAGGRCQMAMGSVMGVCMPPAGDNEVCGGGRGCLGPAVCAGPAGAGACRTPDPTSCEQ